MWYIERYDHAWGGWRRVRGSWLSEEPAQFKRKMDATAAVSDLQRMSPHGKFRIKKED